MAKRLLLALLMTISFAFVAMPVNASTNVSGRIAADTTWTLAGSPYIVYGIVQVYGTTAYPVALTIEPGVVVRFTSTGGLQIGSGANQGALIAQGTAAAPILFTRNGSSGSWKTLNFQDGTVDASTVLEHVEVRYSTGIYMYTTSPILRDCSILDTTGNYGFYLNNASPQLENVTFTGSNPYGLYLTNYSAPKINEGSLTNTSASGHGIYGTGSPIISNHTVSITQSPGKYGIYLTDGNYAMSLTNSTISYGLYLGVMGFVPTITGNTITVSDASPLHAGANMVGQLLNANTFFGMTATGKIEVVSESVTHDAVWKKWPAPYVISGVVYIFTDPDTLATLTIEAGAQLRFNTNAKLQVGYSNYQGVLLAQGTAAEPIVFTTNQIPPTAGSWSGIVFANEVASASVIEHAIIEYAGSGGLYWSANVAMTSSSPTLRHCILRNSASSGLYLGYANTIPRIYDTEITGNKWGVYSISSNPRIGNSRIYGNTTAGVWNTSPTSNIDARGNWWGAASGPTYASNPGGAGALITDGVTYDPWLTESPNTLLTITDPSVQPTVLNPAGGSVVFVATLSAPSDWTIIVTNGSGATVKTFSGSGSSINKTWTGKNEQGEIVDDGAYTYQISATNGTGTAAPVKGTLVVSSLITAKLVTPLDNQMFTAGVFVNIIGTATAISDFKDYVLAYGAGENPVSWIDISNSPSQVNNGLLHTWDTVSLAGSYMLRLTVSDNLGNVAVVNRRLRFMRIQDSAPSQTLISPNGDGIKDETTVTATFAYPSNWTLTIKNEGGTPVRVYTGTGTALSQIWDGKNDSGVVVPDGVYTWQIDATCQETGVQAPTVIGSCFVDITPPTAIIAAPTANASVFNTVAITGTASDANFDYYRLEVEPVGGTATPLVESTFAVIAQTLVSWTTNDQGDALPLPNGDYLFWLTVVDKAGNISSVIRPVTVDNLLVTNVSASTHQIDTSQSEVATIQFSVNAPATATVKIIPEPQGLTGTPIYQTSQNCPTSGIYSFNWVGRNTAGNVVSDEAYLYIIEVSDGTRSDTYAPAQPSGSGNISCSQENDYHPYTNDPLTITYAPAQAARINITISCGLQSVELIEDAPHAAGSYTVDWDGRNQDGTIFEGEGRSSCAVTSLLAENHLVTTGDIPKISMVQSDPYQMSLSFGQFVKVRYQLSSPTIVTVKLIAPSGTSYTLLNAQSQLAGVHEVEHPLFDATDPDNKTFRISEQGDYTVLIHGVNPVTGTTKDVKGYLKVRF